MAIVTEISITRFPSTGWFRSSIMQGAPKLLDASNSLRNIVSSSYDGKSTMSQGLQVVETPNHIQSGSFSSSPSSVAVYDVTISVSSGMPTMHSGTFKSTPQSHGIYSIATEDHNKSLVTSDNPMANQSVSNVQWNFFPIPEVAESSELGKDRDLTRYQKAYSFSRKQPVRVRIIRR